MSVGAAFAVMNSDMANLNYYFGSNELPLSVIIVAAIGVGVLLGLLAGFNGVIRLKHENRELRRKIRLTAQEVNNLRAIPIKE